LFHHNKIYARNVAGMTDILESRIIGIAGCGGLGSNAAIALARAGIGRLILADYDYVEESNLNRQYFFKFDVGKAKVDALADHIRHINSDIMLELHNLKLEPDDIPRIFGDADILIEAFDRAEAKFALIDRWCKEFPQKPLIVGNGLSGCGHTNELKVVKAGQLYFCGDEKTDIEMGLCSARVAIVANMQANVAIQLLLGGGKI